MSDENIIKEKFKNFGLYMVEKAQEEIKKLNQRHLFQKAEMKKKYKANLIAEIGKTQKNFEEKSNNFFNDSLNSALLEFSQKMLNLKLDLVKELKNETILKVKDNIKNNNSKYIKYTIANIKKITGIIKGDSPVNLIFNSKDYDYFNDETNFKKIQNLFNIQINITKSSKDFIGGFIFELPELNITYSNTFDDLIDKKSSIFEIELSKIITDENFEKIKNDLIDFVNSQRSEINIIKGQLNNNE